MPTTNGLNVNSNVDAVQGSLNALQNAYSDKYKSLMVQNEVVNKAINTGIGINQYIEESNYKKNSNIAVGVIAKANDLTTAYMNKSKETLDPNLQKQYFTEYQATINGLNKQVSKLNLPNSGNFTDLINQKTTKLQNKAQQHFNQTLLKSTSQQQLANFYSNLSSYINSDVESNDNFKGIHDTAHELMYSPYLTSQERDKVRNSLFAISNNKNISNDPLSAGNENNLNYQLNVGSNIKANNNVIKDMFLDGKTNLSAIKSNMVNLSIPKQVELKKSLDNLNNIYTIYANSSNLPQLLNRWQTSNDPDRQKVANLVQDKIKNGQAQQVIMGSSPTVRQAWDNYNNLVKNNASDGQINNAYQTYSTYLNAQAINKNIPLSQVGDIDQDTKDLFLQLKNNPPTANYVNQFIGTAKRYINLNGDNPINGNSDQAQLLRLYQNSNNTNPLVQTSLAYSYGTANKDLNDQYNNVAKADPHYNKELNNITGDDDYNSHLNSIALISQTPKSEINKVLQTAYKNSIVRNGNIDMARQDVNSVISSFLDSSTKNIGNNHITNKTFFSDLGISNNDAEDYTYHLIAYQLEKITSEKLEMEGQSPSDSLVRSKIRNYLGSPDDYSIVTSNGSIYMLANKSGISYNLGNIYDQKHNIEHGLAYNVAQKFNEKTEYLNRFKQKMINYSLDPSALGYLHGF